MPDSTARAISTVGIWLATAVILAFGLFRMNFNDLLGFLGLFVSVVSICAAAGYGTAAVWGWRPATAPEKPVRGFPVIPLAPDSAPSGQL